MKKMKKKQVNVRKAADYSIIINSVQIVAVLFLYGLMISQHFGGGTVFALLAPALAVVVSAGAAIDIREAFAARRESMRADTLDTTVTQMEELNLALRAQRHDFLNHLQVVYSLMEMEEFRDASEYIEKVYGDMGRISRVMRTGNPAVNALIRAKITACEKLGIRVETDISGDWGNLPIPDWELCRVFSNLIDNAEDALMGRDGAALFLTLREDLCGYSFIIANNGPMIPKDRHERIFEAGVSTHGEGRGMGLFIVRGTLARYGGEIHVESGEEKTSFSGFIPRAEKVHDEENKGA